jgi:hypothetical protein
LKQLIHITCKKATYLISKNEESRLTVLEWIRLQIHLSICSLCMLFQKQTKTIGDNAKHTHEYKHLKLSDSVKEKIQQQLMD